VVCVTTTGNDNTCSFGGTSAGALPCKTINVAMTKSKPGSEIRVECGTYASGPIPMFVGRTLRGVSDGCVHLLYAPTTASTFLTMNDTANIENLNITVVTKSVSTGTTKGIFFGGTSVNSARMRNVRVNVDNSGSLVTGSANLYAVHLSGTGTGPTVTPTIRDCTFIVRGTGTSGAKTGVLVDAPATVQIWDTRVTMIAVSGADTNYVGVLSNNAAATVQLQNVRISAPTGQDLWQQAGSIQNSGVVLLDRTTSGAGMVDVGYVAGSGIIEVSPLYGSDAQFALGLSRAKTIAGALTKCTGSSWCKIQLEAATYNEAVHITTAMVQITGAGRTSTTIQVTATTAGVTTLNFGSTQVGVKLPLFFIHLLCRPTFRIWPLY
jgi:hypothetical protein